MTTPGTATAFFRRRFTEVGTAARAAKDRAYLKSDLRFFGATVPDIRRAAADFARAHRELTRAELRAIVSALYATDRYEYRSVAIALLGRHSALLRESDLPWLAGLVRVSDTWAHVDWLATDVIGGLIERDPAGLRRLPGWARDRSFWVRRTALLAQVRLLARGEGDFAVFARLAAAMLGEREFFIRKAIGWVLRETSKNRPELTFGFFRDHRSEVSALSLPGRREVPAAPAADPARPCRKARVAPPRRTHP